MGDIIQGLIKFGEKEYMEKLLKRGEIFCRPLSYYQKIEENDLAKRHDMFEAAEHVLQSDILKSEGIPILFPGDEGPIDITPYVVGPIIKQGENRTSVFCLYALYGSHLQQYIDGELNILIDEQMKDFGDYAVYIHPKMFIERIKQAVEKLDIYIKCNPTDYVDTTKHHGIYGSFRKPEQDYSFQNEYRILLDNKLIDDPNGTFTLKIGDISDIAFLVSVEDLRIPITFAGGGTKIYNPFIPAKEN